MRRRTMLGVDFVETRPLRMRAAAAARALLEGRMEWEDFAANFGDTADPLISELVALIANEPEVGGFWGVSRLQYRAYRATVERLIADLERDS